MGYTKWYKIMGICMKLIILTLTILMVLFSVGYAWTNYICPYCGSRVEVSIGCSIPPVTIYRCTNPNCDYVKWVRDEMIDVEAPE